MKRGLKTSEAQLTVLTALGALVAAIGGYVPATWTVGGISVSVAAYALSRGLTKAGGAEAFPALAAIEPTTASAAVVDTTAARRAQLQAELAALGSSP